jgi:DNA replication protein DnaC
MVRCPACTDFLKVSRLTPDEQQHTLAHITDRDDDTRDEMLALRFLGRQMLDDPFGMLSIWGRKGGAKSLLLSALVAEFCRKQRPAVYFNASEIVQMLSPGDEAGMGGDWKGDMAACKRKLMDAPVLAIDEVDKIKWSAWQVQHIGEVLEYRHRFAVCRVTLLAMNKPPWQWSNSDDVEHIASRLSDGRFYRRWPDDKLKWLPKCANGAPELPGLFEVTLPDIRPTLRRY